jgi:hypothetical protein
MGSEAIVGATARRRESNSTQNTRRGIDRHMGLLSVSENLLTQSAIGSQKLALFIALWSGHEPLWIPCLHHATSAFSVIWSRLMHAC